MHTIWSGAISFGLVNIPVRLVAALSSKKQIKFNYLHKKCHSRIEYQKHCPKCDMDVPADEIAKGYEYEPGKYVILEEQDFEKVDMELSNKIEVKFFSKKNEIDCIYYDHPYYLVPNENSAKGYFLFYEALKETDKVGVGKFIMRDREYLAVISTKNNHLMLQTLNYADEFIKTEKIELPKKEKVDEGELKIAKNLISEMTEEFKPEEFKDIYEKKLKKLIDKKIKGEKIIFEAPKKPETTENIMEALKKSVAKTKKI